MPPAAILDSCVSFQNALSMAAIMPAEGCLHSARSGCFTCSKHYPFRVIRLFLEVRAVFRPHNQVNELLP